MTTLGVICFSIFVAVCSAGSCIVFHERGYRRGRKVGHNEGYELGRIAANNWWLGSENEIEATRRQIRKEETQL